MKTVAQTVIEADHFYTIAAHTGNVIQAVPPAPLFDDYAAENAGLLQTPLSDAWEVWNDAFLTGKKSMRAWMIFGAVTLAVLCMVQLPMHIPAPEYPG